MALARFLDAGPRTDPWARYPLVLGVEHVAEIMGSTVAAVREAARRGSIPMRKRIGRYVIAQDVFRAWLAGADSAR